MAKKTNTEAEITGKQRDRSHNSLVFGSDLERMGDWMVELGQRLKECGRNLTRKHGGERGQKLARMRQARDGLRAIRDAILESTTKLADGEVVDASMPAWKTSPKIDWLPQ